ncbi:MAG: hypothetical protein K0R54_200 [Clostridiaceae bacterium]|jgi:hypothetical protein|nr:hypothetical protein [Clostridiaceae bacterium]
MAYKYIGYGTYTVKKDFIYKDQEVKSDEKLIVNDIWKADRMINFKRENGKFVNIKYDDLEEIVDLENLATPLEIVLPIFNGIKALFRKEKNKN